MKIYLSRHFQFVTTVWTFSNDMNYSKNFKDFDLNEFFCILILYNDVNNQQCATTFSFISLFNSSLHVSDDKFAHPQEPFLIVYTTFGTMHRHCCRLVPRLRWNVSSISTVRIGEFVARNM